MHRAATSAAQETYTRPASTKVLPGDFDPHSYAREHRYRLRNLHDGRPIPPARRMKAKDEVAAAQSGYVRKEDRHDAIVGFELYLSDEGDDSPCGPKLRDNSAIPEGRTGKQRQRNIAEAEAVLGRAGI